MAKELVFCLIFVSICVCKVLATGNDGSPQPRYDAHLCMWSSEANDCVEGSDNYCICED